MVPARRLLALGLGCGVTLAWAQSHPLVAAAPPASAAGAGGERGVAEWLPRMHDASRQRSYIGTFVVSTNGGAMSSARIWHTADGQLQVERVESLTGAPRSVFRRNEQVVTFLPEAHVVRTERRESLGLFTNLIKGPGGSVPDFYTARRVGADRVAGFETDVVQLQPRDALRYGLRIWSERKSGLVVKLQTLDQDGSVLEQSAFSELVLDAPVRADKLSQMMHATDGWRVEKSEVTRTSPEAEGWQMHEAVPGFHPLNCYKRPVAGAPGPEGTMQWVFSDGLAAVSLFLEPYDANHHAQEGATANGATQSLARRIQGNWWLTAVGEVPPATLRAFAQNLERRR
ncbi:MULTISPECIES: MucB/RseB C-terminal domain-containing protein [Ramlibacter]|nr:MULTISPECIES: MucB/RseB C-terminal domain-containing protein [Ramlibacter]